MELETCTRLPACEHVSESLQDQGKRSRAEASFSYLYPKLLAEKCARPKSRRQSLLAEFALELLEQIIIHVR